MVARLSEGRDLLRLATHDVHMRLHGHPVMRPLLDGCSDAPEYRRVLGHLFGFHAPLEHALFAAGAWLPDALGMDRRLRVAALRRDLGDLGMGTAEIEALPLVRALPRLDSAGRALGALYVREGSTLGGKVMAARLDPLLGAGELSGRRFLNGDADAGSSWRSCCVVIETAAAQGQLADMVAGAQETFAAFEAWLDDVAGQASQEERRYVGHATP